MLGEHGAQSDARRPRDVSRRLAVVGPGTMPAERGEAGEVRLDGVPASLDEAPARVREAAKRLPPACRSRDFRSADLARARRRRSPGAGGARAARCARTASRPSPRLPLDRLGDTENADRGRARGAARRPRRVARDVDRRRARRPARSHRARGRGAARDRRAARVRAAAARSIANDAPSTGYDDVKTIALARLVCRDDSIRSRWIGPLYGPKLAQVAIAYGADDIDGVAADRHARPGTPLARRRHRAADRARRLPNRRSATAGTSRAREPSRPPGRGELSERPAARVRPRPPRRSSRCRFDLPSVCAQLLARGEIDLGMVPSITYLDRPGDRVVPGVCIGSEGRSIPSRCSRACRCRDVRSDRARHVVAHVGDPHAHAVRASFRDLARVRAARAGSPGDARRRGCGAAHR